MNKAHPEIEDLNTVDSYFRWTVAVDIHELWVADGLELTAEKLQDILLQHIGYANDGEVRVQVKQSPPIDEIKKAQG